MSRKEETIEVNWWDCFDKEAAEYAPLQPELIECVALIAKHMEWATEYEANLYSHKEWEADMVALRLKELKRKVLNVLANEVQA